MRQRFLHILFVLFSALGWVSGAAQNYYEDERTFYGGVVVGPNFTQVDGDDFAGYHKIGLNVGGIVYTKMDENLFVSLEILYSQKGSKSNGAQELSSGYSITNYSINLNYAEVPVMLNYFDNHKNHFGGGFSYSRLASYSESITTYPATSVDLNQYPFKKGDLNILLNGSLHLWKGLFLNGRFQYSLISIRDKIPQNGLAKAAQYNNMWTFRLEYLFMK